LQAAIKCDELISLENRKQTLEEQRKVALQRLNARKAEARSVTEECAAMEATQEQRQTKIQQTQNEINRLKPGIDKLRVENTDLREKLKRVILSCIRAKVATYPSLLFEMDVEIEMEQKK
jgi:chromosome segregation ATPase